MDPTTQRLMMASNSNQPFFATLSYSSYIFIPTAFKLDLGNNAYICGYSITPDKAILIKLKFGILGARVEWARSIVPNFGGSQCYDVAVSSDNPQSASIYVVGRTISTLYSFLAKYNSSGTLQWYRSLANPDAFKSVTVDQAGDIYITGSNFGKTRPDVFIAKYNSSGTLQWQKFERYYSTSYDSYGTSIASVPSSGGFVITGYVEVGGSVPADILVTKFYTDGNVVWKKIISTANNDYGDSVGIDSAGNVYVLGSTDGQGAGVDDMYLTKLGGATGNTSWQRSLGSASSESGRKLHVDPSTGDCYIVGDSVRLIVLAKYNSSGTLQWQRSISFGVATDMNVSGISLGPGPDKMLYVMFRRQGAISDFEFIRLDPNGGGTGTFGLTYATINYTDSAGTLSNTSGTIISGTETHNVPFNDLIDAGETVTISGYYG